MYIDPILRMKFNHINASNIIHHTPTNDLNLEVSIYLTLKNKE